MMRPMKTFRIFSRKGYDEINEDFQDLLKDRDRMAVARGDVVYNSPVDRSQRRSLSFTLHLLGIHVCIAVHSLALSRGSSLHKRSRLHFLRGSKEEAARAVEEAKSHFGTGRCPEGDGFSARHASS